MRNTRPIAWLRAARRDFDEFPSGAKDRLADGLTIVADGGLPSFAKPLAGFGSGVLELALAFRGDASRVVYAVGTHLWVVHAFQKKSKSGIATPKRELDLIQARLRQLREMLR